MDRHKNGWGWLALLGMLLAACGPLGWGAGWGRGAPPAGYASNGERIYETGTSQNGRISYSGGDFGPGMMGGGMMGRRLACIDCHGPDGRGGEHVMHMTLMDAPDIRWSTLTEAGHGDEEAGHEESGEVAADEHGEEMDHPAYNEATFARAVTEGLDPAGERLDPAMPRWTMSDEDLADLIAYLKRLS